MELYELLKRSRFIQSIVVNVLSLRGCGDIATSTKVASTKVDKSQVLIELLAKSINQATRRTLNFKVKMLLQLYNKSKFLKEGSE